MSLLHRAREFWYNNTPGSMSVSGLEISRANMQTFGGPAVDLKRCEACQSSEWVSRVAQANRFEPHVCDTAEVAELRCSRQGDDLWPHWHQDFTYGFMVTPGLGAPACAFLLGESEKQRMLLRSCDQSIINLRRSLAQSCQTDMIVGPSVDWSKYDFALAICRPGLRFNRPDIPLVLYGHDLWKRSNELQAVIQNLQPDYFLTPFPTSWRSKYKFPAHTKIRFYCLAASSFLTKTNLGAKSKNLILTGTTGGAIYRPRKILLDYVEANASEKQTTLWRNVGHIRNEHTGPARDGDRRYLTHFSALLGGHQYAAFGEIDDEIQPVFNKHWEYLGSGAVPIFPVSPDFSYLGIEEMVHYIPLRTFLSGGADFFRHLFSHYPEYKPIAINAAAWYKENADRMLFSGFESFVAEVTGSAYPRRLV